MDAKLSRFDFARARQEMHNVSVAVWSRNETHRKVTMHLRRCNKMQQASAFSLRLFGCLTLVSTLFAQEPCRVASPTATFSIPYAKTGDRLDTDPKSPFWSKASSAWILK